MKKIIRSRTFFWLIILFFVFESGWIALSARYPMAFDEDHHLGIIQIYSHQLGPFLKEQPPGPAKFGALTADPSYFYHYIMSFPYRWLTAIFSQPKTIILIMRFMNIAMMAGALILYRRLLVRTRAGPGIINISLLTFILLPITPLLAAEINYDNLVILLLAANLLLVLGFRDQLVRKKQINSQLLLYALGLALIASIVKFVYLPFLLAITLYLLWILYQRLGSIGKVWRNFAAGWRRLGRPSRLAVSLFFVLCLGLFLQRYGNDVVKYWNVEPECNQVLPISRCLAYGPWARNYSYMQQANDIGLGNPIIFTGGWTWGMFERTFFTINGPGNPDSYQNHMPLPLMSITAVSIFGFGLYLLWRYRRYLFENDPALKFLLFTSLIYLAALVGRNYHDYLQFGGKLAAINGRYLLLIIIPVFVAIGRAYQKFVPARRQTTLLAIVMLLFLQGGGFISFLYFSHKTWYWPNDQAALRRNTQAQKIIQPLIVPWPKQSWK